jgi:hypothetical protein
VLVSLDLNSTTPGCADWPLRADASYKRQAVLAQDGRMVFEEW